MNEFELIARLTQDLPAHPSVKLGPGDDCALIDVGWPDRWLLFKTDAVVEGVHFTGETEPEKVGRKALGRCLSDIAAMAGTPTVALVTLGLPRDHDSHIIERIYNGIKSMALQHQVAIAGGETTTNPGGILISISLIGFASKTQCPLRSGGQPGDALFVTGELGGSLQGKHLDFIPRLEEARWLVSNFAVHAMMDISDGLAGDLRHILKASKTGAELLSEAIPISVEARRAATRPGTTKTPLNAALSDGEDFELLFSVSSHDAVRLLDAWKARFPGLRLSCIGKLTSEPGLRMRSRKSVEALAFDGYTHFA
jgi:thiamine-monophosphate kinase